MAAHKSGQSACGPYSESTHKGFTEVNSGYDHDAISPQNKGTSDLTDMSKKQNVAKAKGYADGSA